MALIVPNVGEQLLIDAATGKTAATQWTLRLFSNDYTAVAGSTAANFTEVAGGGYAAIALTAASWVTTPGSPTSSAYPECSFVFTGATDAPSSIFGYFLTNAAGTLIFAERLAASFSPISNGDSVDVTPTLTMASVTSD